MKRDREFLIHYARVLLGEARRFRRCSFHHWLLATAAKARREAAALPRQRALLAGAFDD